jgi:hypothetical protein
MFRAVGQKLLFSQSDRNGEGGDKKKSRDPSTRRVCGEEEEEGEDLIGHRHGEKGNWKGREGMKEEEKEEAAEWKEG